MCSRLSSFPDLCKAIDAVFDQYGNVLDNASPYLAQIRSELSRVSSTVNSVMRRVIARAVEGGYLEKDVTPAVRDGRLVLPVAPMHKRKISGIVHDESATGKTFFIEPAEIVEINNRARELEIEERREILRIFAELTDRIRPFIPEILESYALLWPRPHMPATPMLRCRISLRVKNLNGIMPLILCSSSRCASRARR